MLASNQKQLDRLQARLKALPGRVEGAVTPALQSSNEALAAEMRRLCPVDSGALRDSIRVVPTKKGGFTVEAGGPTAPYIAHVEFGTSKMHAEPFFLPAYRSHRAGIVADIKKAAVAAIKSGGKS